MKHVVVTGGTGGLGTEVVRRLSLEYRCTVLGHAQADLTDEASVHRAFSELGEIYGLVHLVGGWAPGRVEETTAAEWERMLSLNATTAFLAARAALGSMTRPGRIVAVSSIATLQPQAGSAAYVVAKSALNAFVAVLAEEQRASGITVNAVLPDSMATPAMLRAGGDASALVPLERVGGTIAFLLSEQAAGITGARIAIRA